VSEFVVVYTVTAGERFTPCTCAGFGLSVAETCLGDWLEVTEFHAEDCANDRLAVVMRKALEWLAIQQEQWPNEAPNRGSL